jgi:deazaflavin-dependent oxidoreductase (nitroreductase family)
VATDTINGIRRVDLQGRPLWKRNLGWALGGPLFASKKGLALWARVAAPVEAPLMKATGGRVRLAFSIPVVVLTSIGARSGQRRDNPLAYFTDGDGVVLIASNSGGARHPAWYHNLVAHPECELHIGQRGGSFVAREVTGPDRDRLYTLAAERLAKVFFLHEKRSGSRTIPVMRLTPTR